MSHFFRWLCLALALIVWPARASADVSVDELKPVDLDGDGKMENVSLFYSEPDDYGNCTASFEIKSLGKTYSVPLKEGLNLDTTYLKALVL